MSEQCPQCNSDLAFVESTASHYCSFCGWMENTHDEPEHELQETPTLPKRRRPMKPFWKQALESFGYPFKGNGWGFMLSGVIMTVLIALLWVILETVFNDLFQLGFMGYIILIIITFALSMMAFFTICEYIFIAIRTTVEGSLKPPMWSDRKSDGRSPGMQVITVTLIFALVPFALLLLFRNYSTLAMVSFVIGYLWFCIAWPMAILRVCISRSIGDAVNPILLGGSIIQVFKDYAIIFLFYIVGSYLVQWIVTLLMIPIIAGTMIFAASLQLTQTVFPVLVILPSVASVAVLTSMYILLVGTRMLGLLYRYHSHQLIW